MAFSQIYIPYSAYIKSIALAPNNPVNKQENEIKCFYPFVQATIYLCRRITVHVIKPTLPCFCTKCMGLPLYSWACQEKWYIKRFTVPATKPVSKSPKRIKAYNEFMAALFTRLMYNFLSVFIMLESQLAISYKHIWYTNFDFQSHKQLDHFFFNDDLYLWK